MNQRVNETFGDAAHYVCVGDSIEFEIKGKRYRAHIEYDEDAHIDGTDCWNPDQSVTGCDDKQQAELMVQREAWFRNEWQFVRVVVMPWCECCEQWKKSRSVSVGGIESNRPGNERECAEYLTELAHELAGGGGAAAGDD